MGIRLIEGRGLNDRDTEKAPNVALISKSVADKFWPGTTAIGRKLESKLGGFPGDVWWPYFLVAALVITLAQVASFIPARRAAATDVQKALTTA